MGDSESSANAEHFVIVKFPEENDLVAVVPSVWMVGNDHCYWPPRCEQKKVGLFVKKMKQPESTWMVINCVEMGRYDTYGEARQMLPVAENTSDLNAEVQYGRGKRRRFRTLSSSSNDSSNDPQLTTPPPSGTGKKSASDGLQMQQKLPTVRHDNVHLDEGREVIHGGLIRENLLARAHRDSSQQSASVASSSTQVAPAPGLHSSRAQSFERSAEFPRCQSRHQSLGAKEKTISEDSSLHRKGSGTETLTPRHMLAAKMQKFQFQRHISAGRSNIASRPPSHHSDGSAGQLDFTTVETASDFISQMENDNESLISLQSASTPRVSHRTPEFERKVLNALGIIKLRLHEHSEQLDTILSSLRGSAHLPGEEIITESFSTIKDFLDFEKDVCTSTQKRDMLHRFMTNLGGRNSGDMCRRIMSQLLTDEVAVQFNWTGTLGKKEFKSLQCTNVMLRAVNQSFPHSTMAEAEKAVQTWLRHANERIQKRAHRSAASVK